MSLSDPFQDNLCYDQTDHSQAEMDPNATETK